LGQREIETGLDSSRELGRSIWRSFFKDTAKEGEGAPRKEENLGLEVLIRLEFLGRNYKSVGG